MSFTLEQAKELIHLYYLDEVSLANELVQISSDVLLDYDQDDFNDPAKRRRAVIVTLEAVAENIGDGYIRQEEQ